MLAAYHGHAELVKLLIEHGADPNRVNDRGQSPLAGAVFKKEDAVIEVCVNVLQLHGYCSSLIISCVAC
jgi:ankyrin repeat protein